MQVEAQSSTEANKIMNRIAKRKKPLNCFIIMPFTGAKFTNKEGTERELDENELTHIYARISQVNSDK